MSKQAGMGDQLYVGGYNLSGDVGALDEISSPRGMLDSTGIDKSARERMSALHEGLIDFTTFFNPAAGSAFKRLSLLPTTDVPVCYFRGQAIGNPAAGMLAKQVNYDPSRGDDGSLTIKCSMQSESTAVSTALDWGEQLTAGVAVTGAAGSQTSYDYGAAVGTTNFGLQAYLHVFAFTGTSATVAIQSSTDNAVGDPFANVTGAVFTAATGVTSQRIETGRTAAVERYLRVNVTGTFSLFWFAVMVARNPASVIL